MEFAWPVSERSDALPPIEGFPDLDPDARWAIEVAYGELYWAWFGHWSGNCWGCEQCSDCPTREKVAAAHQRRP